MAQSGLTTKREDEKIRLGVDYTKSLAEGDSVTSTYNIKVYDSDNEEVTTMLVTNSEQVSGNILSGLFQGGDEGETYKIVFSMTTQNKEELEEIVSLLVTEIIIGRIIKLSDLQDWIEPSPLDSDYRKLEIITEGVVADAEDYIDGKIKEVTDEVAYLDGGRSYLIIPHLNVTKISVWEDTSRVFPDSTMIDPTKYQVYTERGILRIGRPKHKESGGIAWMDRYFSDYYWDDYYFDRFFEGRREFLRGRQVIKVKYDGGWNQDTLKENLRLAIITQVGYRYRRRKDPGLSTVTYPDGSVTKMADIKQFLPEVQAVLDKFKRISIA